MGNKGNKGEWNMYGKWMKDLIKVEMWAGELGMFVRGVESWEYGNMQKGNKSTCGREGKRGIAKGN